MKPFINQYGIKQTITLGHILLTIVHNKFRWSTDAFRHSSELRQLDADMLSVVTGEGVCSGFSPSSAWGLLPLKLLAAKQMPSYLLFTSFHKSVCVCVCFQISFGLAKTRCLYRSFVKVKWHKANFWKARDTCISCSNPIIISSRSLGSFDWKIALEIKI